MNREWIEKFYSECGREVSLAYNVLNYTNNWGVTLATAVIAIALISTVGIRDSGIVLRYPTTVHWFVVIVAWIIMSRFFVRSCLALTNMYRWNTLIKAAVKVLSLSENHADLPVFERNFYKQVKTYFFEWKSPIPQSKIAWNTLKLMYLPFFITLFVLIVWGFIALDRTWIWGIAMAIFIGVSTWEARQFLTWYGLQYEAVDLEDEPEVTEIWARSLADRSKQK